MRQPSSFRPRTFRKSVSSIVTDIQDHVRRNGLTAYSIAKLSGMPQSTVHRLLHHQNVSAIARVEHLLAAIGVTVSVVDLRDGRARVRAARAAAGGGRHRQV
jgi:D-alanyl-D-alanine dipeptidase